MSVGDARVKVSLPTNPELVPRLYGTYPYNCSDGGLLVMLLSPVFLTSQRALAAKQLAALEMDDSKGQMHIAVGILYRV